MQPMSKPQMLEMRRRQMANGRLRPLRVLIVDDHRIVRTGVRLLLERAESVDVVGEAHNGREALVLAKKLRPDVVVMDLAMPRLNGLEALRRVKRRVGCRTVALTMHSEPAFVTQALGAGASGYVLKSDPPEMLVEAVRKAARGETFLSPGLDLEAIEKPPPISQLTSRQREVLQLIAEGRSTRQISAELNISIKTVETHRANLMHRLNVSTTPDLVRFAIRQRVIDIE